MFLDIIEIIGNVYMIYILIFSVIIISVLIYFKKKNIELNHITIYEEKVETCKKTSSRQLLYIIAKRIMDIFLAIFAMIGFLPLFVASAISIKLEDGGTIIAKREIVGLNYKKICKYSFRTIRMECYKNQDSYEVKITKTGKFLRRTALDMLPVFYNVLIGNMSIVGLGNYNWKEYSNPADTKKMFQDCKPGVISAYVLDSEMFSASKEKRMLYDEYYYNNRSITLDLRIISNCIMRSFE